MSLSYPLMPPVSPAPRSINFMAYSVVGYQESPFTKQQTVYVHPGECWSASIELPPMEREEARQWIAFIVGLNGREGTFLLGDPRGATPVGSWLMGSPVATVNGAHAAGVKTVSLRDLVAGATGKAGDWIQFGSGSGTHLHMVVQDFTASGGGVASVEIWPRTRAALAHSDAFVVNGAAGLWRLAENERGWSVDALMDYGVNFKAMEAM